MVSTSEIGVCALCHQTSLPVSAAIGVCLDCLRDRHAEALPRIDHETQPGAGGVCLSLLKEPPVETDSGADEQDYLLHRTTWSFTFWTFERSKE